MAQFSTLSPLKATRLPIWPTVENFDRITTEETIEESWACDPMEGFGFSSVRRGSVPRFLSFLSFGFFGGYSALGVLCSELWYARGYGWCGNAYLREKP